MGSLCFCPCIFDSPYNPYNHCLKLSRIVSGHLKSSFLPYRAFARLYETSRHMMSFCFVFVGVLSVTKGRFCFPPIHSTRVGVQQKGALERGERGSKFQSFSLLTRSNCLTLKTSTSSSSSSSSSNLPQVSGTEPIDAAVADFAGSDAANRGYCFKFMSTGCPLVFRRRCDLHGRAEGYRGCPNRGKD